MAKNRVDREFLIHSQFAGAGAGNWAASRFSSSTSGSALATAFAKLMRSGRKRNVRSTE